MQDTRKISVEVKQMAAGLGFDYCGIARAEALPEDARRLEKWLNKGMHGSMGYMERHFDLRTDPTRLVPGANSVITVLLNYFPEKKQEKNAPKISRYAYGKDYHLVIRSRLNQFLDQLRERFGDIQGRGFVDSAPVLERSWSQRSGLGWIGKNGNLITRQSGSYLFIATLITDLDLESDPPFAGDFCGTCTRCIDACPTQAILDDRVIDGSKCISYFTIELKDQLIPTSFKHQFDEWIFGCDTCQEVCPWNRFSTPTRESEFEPIHEILQFSLEDWQALNEDAFKRIFKDSPLKRAGFKGMQRNLGFILNKGTGQEKQKDFKN